MKACADRLRFASLGRAMASLGLAFGYVGLLLWIFPRRYDVNDTASILLDVQLGLPASFMSPWLGDALGYGYGTLSPDVPWFGLLLYAVHALSLTALAYCVLTIAPSRAWKAVGLVALFTLFGPFILAVGYNGASLWAGFAGSLLYATYLLTTPQPRWVAAPILGTALVLSYALRQTGILAVLAIGAPMLIGHAVGILGRRSYQLVLFFLPLALIMLAHAAVVRAPETPEAAAFEEWNHWRGRFHGHPVALLNLGNEAVLRANDWTPTDYEMLLWWSHWNEDKYDVGAIKNVFRHSVPLASTSRIDWSILQTLDHRVWADYVPAWLLLALLVLAAFAWGHRRTGATVAAYGLYVAGGALALALLARFPTRVGAPVLLSSALWMAFTLARDRTSASGPRPDRPPAGLVLWGRRIFWAGFVALLAYGLIAIPVLGRRIEVDQDRHSDRLRALEALDADILVIYPTPEVGLDASCRDPLIVHSDELRRVPMGWSIFSPRFYRAIRSLGLQYGRDVIPRVVGNPNAYVVGCGYYAQLLARLGQETLGIACRATRVRELGPDLAVFRLERD